MAAISLTAADIHPVGDCVIRRYDAGGTVTPGQAVYVDTNGAVQACDANASAAASRLRGVVVSDAFGATSFASGDRVDVVVRGAVAGYSGMTAGAPVFNSDTAGALDQTASATSGAYVWAAGYAESATVLFVQPQSNVPTVNA
jgi:hypothetical protein